MKKNILMVDDNVELIEIVKGLFSNSEFNFVGAKDGVEGLFKAQNQKFDAIICDVKMPKIDGETFITEFRKKTKEDIPIIIYSGNLDALPANIQQLKNIFKVPKPAQGYELVQRIRCLVYPADASSVKVLPIRFEAGHFIFKETDNSSTCYFIKEGVVEIIKEFADGTEAVLASLYAGDFLGSYMPVDERFRTFTARAKTNVQLKEISQAQIEKELEGKPDWFKALLLSSHSQMKSIHKTLKQKKAS